MNFSENLKKARNKKNYTKAKMAELLDIPYTSYNNFENGREPKVEMMLKIARVLNISLYELIGKEGMSAISADEWRESWINTSLLSDSEINHIKKYRSLSSYDKETVDTLVNRLSDKPMEFVQIQPPVLVPYYGHIASAGTGQYVFDDIPPELIEVDDEIADYIDFAVGVNGDSMDPTYYDGDILLVKKQSSINVGEIGIFMVNGEAYVKELGSNKLLSHNSSYKDIPLTEDTICIGKVIGVK